jgi:hypothetical protein
MSDDFDRAYDRAKSRFTNEGWLFLTQEHQTAAVYQAMRELDAEWVAQRAPIGLLRIVANA